MIYVCEYDNTTDSRILLEAAGCLFLNKNVLDIKEADKEGIRWTKLRERILAWLLLEYALQKEGGAWINKGESSALVDKPQSWKRKSEGSLETYGTWSVESGSYVDRLEIMRTEHGKPYSSRYPELFFNISHCDTACACVVSDCPVGIDIEKKFPYKENLKRHVCCEAEEQLMEAWLPEEWDLRQTDKKGMPGQGAFSGEQQLQFLWSMKEAFVKMDGRGLGYGMRNINLAELLPIKDGECKTGREGVSFAVKSQNKYTLAVCEVSHAADEVNYAACEANHAVGRGKYAVYETAEVLKEQELFEWLKKVR